MGNTKEIADHLIKQHREKKPFTNLKDDLRPISTEQAYLAQLEFQARASRGPLGGFKIGLTSRAQQELCGIDTPIAGGIFSKEIFSNNHQICLEEYHGLGLEFELAFQISNDILPNDTEFSEANVLSHVSNVYPAFELIIDRDADYKNLDALTIIADNSWSAGVVLGDPIPDWQSLNLNALNASLYWNFEPKMHAQIKSANPIGSLAWIIHHLRKLHMKIPQNSIIMTGSVLQTRKPMKGDEIIYEIESHSKVAIKVI